ncbi:MAG: hypothetical protein LBQ59_01255, partial [Candidatus Peribacteria bacterium]|nr:hypothetical protein [Candidatus Peribacteria bacterium]
MACFSSLFEISLTTIEIFFLSNPLVNTFGFSKPSLSIISALTFFVAVAVRATMIGHCLSKPNLTPCPS